MNKQEQEILQLYKLTASEQEKYIKENPFETLSMIWYLIGYSGIIKRMEEEGRERKRKEE